MMTLTLFGDLQKFKLFPKKFKPWVTIRMMSSEPENRGNNMKNNLRRAWQIRRWDMFFLILSARLLFYIRRPFQIIYDWAREIA
jgi:hypothetical protein